MCNLLNTDVEEMYRSLQCDNLVWFSLVSAKLGVLKCHQETQTSTVPYRLLLLFIFIGSISYFSVNTSFYWIRKLYEVISTEIMKPDANVFICSEL
jgi:hypothetical protein